MKQASEKGAIFGLLVSFALTAWMSFGGASINVDHPKLPTSTEGCLESNDSITEMLQFNKSEQTSFSYRNITDFFTDEPQREEYIFPLYKISYMWFAPIGVCTALVFGYFSSYLFDQPSDLDVSLLSPIAKKLKIVKTPEKSSDVELTSAAALTEGSVR